MGIFASIRADASAGIRVNGRSEMRRPRLMYPFHAASAARPSPLGSFSTRFLSFLSGMAPPALLTRKSLQFSERMVGLSEITQKPERMV